jgi:uncharacterized protein (DUF983 family)
MGETSSDNVGQPGIIPAALFGLCPRCGARSQFVGLVRFASRCFACDLDYSRFNVGDGPAAFLTMVVGALVVGLAMWLQLAVEPPFWVHVVLWVPFTTVAVVWGLRVGKAALLVIEYRRGAREARGEDVRGK